MIHCDMPLTLSESAMAIAMAPVEIEPVIQNQIDSDVTPKVNTSKATGEEKRIRVVGPVFLPDPEAAVDLQAPDRNPVR